MPIIIKGSFEILGKAEQTPPTTTYWDPVARRFVKPEPMVEEPVVIEPVFQEEPTIELEPVVETVEETVKVTPSIYHEKRNGDLHRLFNTKSDYLRDMVDINTKDSFQEE